MTRYNIKPWIAEELAPCDICGTETLRCAPDYQPLCLMHPPDSEEGKMSWCRSALPDPTLPPGAELP